LINLLLLFDITADTGKYETELYVGGHCSYWLIREYPR